MANLSPHLTTKDLDGGWALLMKQEMPCATTFWMQKL